MAIIDVNFYSNKLNKMVTYKAIVPIDGPSLEKKNVEFKPFKTLYLLHGIMGNYTDWTSYTNVITYANKHGLAVIMPSGDNSFYVDQKDANNLYGEYIGEELVNETRKLLPLSKRREDTFIGGLSMGGYGAIRNGLKYASTFGAIIGLSSGLIQDAVINVKEDTNEGVFNNKRYFQSVFGDISKLKGSDMDVEALVTTLITNQVDIPRIYLACGREDFLIAPNRGFHQFLDKNSIPHTYVEDEGSHTWDFWDKYINLAIKWLFSE